MIDRFQELLNELGKVLHMTLHADQYHACSIQATGGLTVQFQLDHSQENLLLFSRLHEIPPGKFRENVLREALKANALPDPRIGVLAHIYATNQLALFQKYPLHILNGERLAGVFGAFLEYGDSWKEALAHGQSAPSSHESRPSSNPFGLK